MMEEFFRTWIYSLLASGCVCSILLFFNTDGKMKSLLETGCACIMVLTFISPLDEISIAEDMNAYFQKWSTMDSQIFEYDEYTKSFMESEYSTYILNEANRLGLILTQVSVSAIQDQNKNWIPYEVFYQTEYPIPSEFIEHIVNVLGITEERQYVNGQNTMGSIKEGQ